MTKHLQGQITNRKTSTTYDYDIFQGAADEIIVTLRDICFRIEHSKMYVIPVKHYNGDYCFKVNKKSISVNHYSSKTDAEEAMKTLELVHCFQTGIIERLIFSGNISAWR